MSHKAERSMVSTSVAVVFIVFASMSSAYGGDFPAGGYDIPASAWPFQSRLVVNPDIVEMLETVSPDAMITNLDTLVGFYTRHTTSDTVSSERGIGAARRWIFDKFTEYASDPETFGLDPGYFTFEAQICGAQGEHRNVIAALPGVETPFRYFVDMGHMDSRTIDVCDNQSFAPSANDDGSGTVVAMEMARVMSRYPLESTMIILIVTGEDEGLYGSGAYAQWAFYNDINIGAVITNDVVGNIEGCENPSCPPGEPVLIDSTSVRHFSGPPAEGVSRQLTRYMKLKAMEYVEDFTIDLIPTLDRPGRSGDHVPFHNYGYPAARFTEAHENGDGSGFNGRQHNGNDTISVINTNPGYMANIARINIAGMASLALGPTTPSGLEASDMGDGSRVMLAWADEQYEPDFSGYRIAIRPSNELFYTDIVDAGDSSVYLLDGLNDGETYYLSVSAYDIEGNESLFSGEVIFTPMSTPAVPVGVDATSMWNGVHLDWPPNHEIDMDSYNVYRQAPNQNEPVLIGSVDHPVSDWVDVWATPHVLYRYFVTAVDDDSNESDFSEFVLGQLATHDYGILIVDGTLNGGGNPFQPTDEEVDQYYDQLTADFVVGGRWDMIDSSDVDVGLSDAHLAPYSTVLLHSDRPGSQVYADTIAYRKYLDNGGNLLAAGWNLSLAIGGSSLDWVDFPAGSFFQDYLKVDSMGVSSSQNRDFVMAPSLLPSFYPDLVIDSAKVPLFGNRLFRMEAFFGRLIDDPVTEAIYSYFSSLGEDFPLHGRPDGLRYLGDDYGVVVIDVPLFFIKQEIAAQVVGRALSDLGEVQLGVDNEGIGGSPRQLGILSNYPNPFNASTVISFRLAFAGDARLEIYNLLGQKVETIFDSFLQAGVHSVSWQADDLPSGIYFARLHSNGRTVKSRMTVLK